MLKSSAWDPMRRTSVCLFTEGDLIRREGLPEEPPDYFSGVISVVLGGNQIVFRAIQGIYKDVIFDTSPVAGKGYINSENRRKQGVSCGFRYCCRYSISPIKPRPERG